MGYLVAKLRQQAFPYGHDGMSRRWSTHRFRNKKSAETAKPTATKTQFSIVMGDQDMSATGIQMRFAYPYSAQHSRTLALSLPNHLKTPHSATGTTPVYP